MYSYQPGRVKGGKGFECENQGLRNLANVALFCPAGKIPLCWERANFRFFLQLFREKTAQCSICFMVIYYVLEVPQMINCCVLRVDGVLAVTSSSYLLLSEKICPCSPGMIRVVSAPMFLKHALRCFFCQCRIP